MVKMACIHKPNGKCVGTVSPYRLLTLRKLFDAASASGTHSTMTPKPASFEKEMVDMVLRHKPKKKAENKQSDQWGIPQISDEQWHNASILVKNGFHPHLRYLPPRPCTGAPMARPGLRRAFPCIQTQMDRVLAGPPGA